MQSKRDFSLIMKNQRKEVAVIRNDVSAPASVALSVKKSEILVFSMCKGIMLLEHMLLILGKSQTLESNADRARNH